MTFKVKIPDSEWVKWGGGYWGEKENASVAFKLRDNSLNISYTKYLVWGHDGVPGDIIAYCILEIE